MMHAAANLSGISVLAGREVRLRGRGTLGESKEVVMYSSVLWKTFLKCLRFKCLLLVYLVTIKLLNLNPKTLKKNST